VTVIKIITDGGTDTKDQWNETENPEIDPYKYNHLIFDTGTKAIQWRKDIIFQQMVLEQPGHP